MTKKIAIIGAGPSGLVSAKAAIEHSLECVVFEKSAKIGGLWNDATGFTWHGMHTNISKHTDVFPDFPWPQGTQDFPTTAEMYAYLQDYAKSFDLLQHIKFNTEVREVKKDGTKWRVITASASEEFDNVIVACGIFSSPDIPNIFGKNTIHSSAYKDAKTFAGLDVVVVGGGMSGVEIAADVAMQAKSVTHFFTTPSWIIPRYLGAQKQPLDLVFYHQPKRVDPSEILLKTALGYRQTNTYMASLCAEQTHDLHSPLYIDPQSTKPQNVAISDNYIKLVQEQKIIPIKARFEQNSFDPRAAVICCTGYKATLGFFNPEILKAINFNPEDKFNPLVLYKTTWHPELPGIGFVGVYRGQYPQVMYYQARWLAMVFSAKKILPDNKAMHLAMENERQIRELPREDRPQFPHPDYPGHLHSIKQEVEPVAKKTLRAYGLFCSNKTLLTLAVGASALSLMTVSYVRSKNAYKF